MMLLYTVGAIICLFLTVYYANTGDVAKVVMYCFFLHWYRDWMIREDSDRNG